jgi:hypothetical protein
VPLYSRIHSGMVFAVRLVLRYSMLFNLSVSSCYQHNYLMMRHDFPVLPFPRRLDVIERVISRLQ